MNNYDWNKTKKLERLATEIESLPPKFELNAYFSEMNKCLEKLNDIIYGDQFTTLVESAKYLQRLMQLAGEVQGMLCVYRDKNIQQYLEGKTRDLKREIIWIPVHLIDIFA